MLGHFPFRLTILFRNNLRRPHAKEGKKGSFEGTRKGISSDKDAKRKARISSADDADEEDEAEEG